jgi:hypothetical protein
MYRHRPRHRAARVLWRPAAPTVLLVLSWAAMAGLIAGAVASGRQP